MFDSELTPPRRVANSDQPEEEETLQQAELKSRHQRNERFKNTVNYIALYGLCAIAGAVALCGGAYLFHMLTPEKWHFLSFNQLEQVRTFVVTAILSSSLTNYANRYIKEEE